MPRVLAVCLPDPSSLQDAVHWEGWGTSLASGNDQALLQQLCTLLFSRDASQGLGMNIVRYNIGGADPAAAAEYRTGAAVPCLRRPDGSYDWGADAAQVAVLLEAVRLGADIVEAFVNSPPYFWTVSGSSRGHKQPLRSNLQKQHIQDFAVFCADVLQHFDSKHGIRMQSLSPFNEPASPAWCLQLNNKQEGCYFSKPRSHKVLRALAQQPALQGTQLIAFEQFCCHDTLSDLRRMPKDLWPSLHRVNTHTYTSKHFFQHPLKLLLLWQDNTRLWRPLLRRQLQRHGSKPLWVSEFGTGRGPLALAKQIVKDLATLRPTAWVYWQAVEGMGANWGLLEAPLDACCSTAAAAAATAAGAAAQEASLTSAAADAPSSSGVAVAAQDGAAAAGGQGDTAAAAAAAAVSPPRHQVLVHRNFFVVQFLMQCLPADCSYSPVKQLGQCGVLVRRSCKHAVLVFVNSSVSKPQVLAVDARVWLQAAAADGVQARQQLREPGCAESSSTIVQPAVGAAGAAAAAAGQVVQVRVALLDLQALQSVQYSAAAGLRSSSSIGSTVREQPLAGNDWPLRVEVPAASLCRVDFLA
uniref:Endo-beta-1,6-galactanase-like domain-containing protein n=1 Tax=Tetradesmus obliquus TaxID=3088 RepID=A0A383WIJ3_TETOB|eukprot:jgi/Sobl393_1/19609/SZX77063.1